MDDTINRHVKRIRRNAIGKIDTRILTPAVGQCADLQNGIP